MEHPTTGQIKMSNKRKVQQISLSELHVADVSLSNVAGMRGVPDLLSYIRQNIEAGTIAVISAWHVEDSSYIWSTTTKRYDERYFDVHMSKLSVRLDTHIGCILDVW